MSKNPCSNGDIGLHAGLYIQLRMQKTISGEGERIADTISYSSTFRFDGQGTDRQSSYVPHAQKATKVIYGKYYL